MPETEPLSEFFSGAVTIGSQRYESDLTVEEEPDSVANTPRAVAE